MYEALENKYIFDIMSVPISPVYLNQQGYKIAR